MKTLEKTFGSIVVSEREAAIMAVKENDDVTFYFNDKKQIITLSEAKELLPKLASNSLKIIKDLQKRENDVLIMLAEEIEALKLIK